MNYVYLDWAATAPADKAGLDLAYQVAAECYANPSSPHAPGRRAGKMLAEARERSAAVLGCTPDEIIFTSGGTEANNLVSQAYLQSPKGHILSSRIEHASVYKPLERAEQFGITRSLVDTDSNGRVCPQEVAESLTRDTVFAAFMLVNNEIGTLQPVKEIVEAIRRGAGKRRIHVHTDAVQALGKIDFSLDALGVDSAAFSAHKIGGPRGAGILYCKRSLPPVFLGGGQEHGVRPGTENLAVILAMTAVMEKRQRELQTNIRNAREHMDFLIHAIARIPGARLLPPRRSSTASFFSPFILSVAFLPVPGEVIVRVLSDRGYAVSTGAACSSRGKRETRVIDSLGLDSHLADSAIRISIGYHTRKEDLEGFVHTLQAELPQLQKVVAG